MEIRPFTPDDTDVVDRVVELVNATGKIESPWAHPMTRSDYEGALRYGWDGEPPTAYAAYVGGRLVGHGELSTSEWDNRHLAWLAVTVDPDDRRRGYGSRIFEFLVELAREQGRTSVGADGWDLPSVHGFTARHGLEPKSAAVNRRQYLRRIDLDAVRRLRREAAEAASAYDLLQIEGRTPEGMLAAVAEMAAAINDAPTDDLDIEDEVFTAERLVNYETATLSRKRRMYRVVARHRESGELAGHTVVAVEVERPHIGYQHDTSVVRAHRGHRLGLLVKTAMVEWLAEREPQLESVDTWNAESNDHMIDVNEQLGYTVLARAHEFQRGI
jgi:GNAT superfamily N-acetyltransferase